MKDNKELILLMLVLFVVVGLLYSPLKKYKQSHSVGQSSSSIQTSSNTNYSQSKSTEESLEDIQSGVKNLQKNLSEEVEKSKRSPYYDKIRMSSIWGLNQADPSQEYLSISTSLSKNETVKITGWYLKSEITGYYAAIGGASLLPFPFNRNDSDVVLERGDRVYLTKGFSPIGISFRTNKCTGYFEEDRTFYPSLRTECPRAEDENLPKFSNDYDVNDDCVMTIERISRCTTVDSEFIRDLPDTIPQSCKDYMADQINYNTCVALHYGDTDFPSGEYRIYLNKFGPLWLKMHDKINLYDQNGLIVDSISY